jgi:hypothetical protein
MVLFGKFGGKTMENKLNALVLTKEGWIFVSKRKVEYRLLEGVCLGTNRRITSDTIFIVLDNPDYDVDEMIVGYLFGARIFENNLSDYEESIIKMVDEFEERNF